MGKRRRISSPIDRITEDGILCSIISSLSLREAVRTCVLSRRWKYVWTHIPRFTFDDANMFDANTLRSAEESILRSAEESDTDYLTDDEGDGIMKERDGIMKERTYKFIQSVDLVLQQRNRCVRIDELTIEFYLHKLHSHHLDAWIRLLAASKIKRLNLDLSQTGFSCFLKIDTEPEPEPELYVFPFQLLASSYVQHLFLMSCSLKLPSEFNGLNHLNELHLDTVSINEEDVKRLLSNCPVLEYLRVSSVEQLVTLSIPHTLSRLQSLYVDDCSGLRRIETGAMNRSLRYQGHLVDFTLQQSSELVDGNFLFRDEGTTHSLEFYLTYLSSNFPHLQYLTLNLCDVSRVGSLLEVSNRFIKLTSLHLTWSVHSKLSLLCLATLLAAAPFLEEFKLHILTRVVEKSPPRIYELKKKMSKESKRLYPYLRRLIIYDFNYDKCQVAIILYLLNNATELEEMAIYKGCKISKKNMKNLSREVPANVKLVITKWPSRMSKLMSLVL